MDKTKLALLAVLLVVVPVGVWWWTSHKAAGLQAAKQEAARWKGIADTRLEEANSWRSEVARIRASNDALASTIRELKIKVDKIPVPSPPGLAPDDKTIQTTLGVAGFTFDWGTDRNLVLARDARLLWKWQQESLNAPILREKVSGLQLVTDQQDKLLGGKDHEIHALNSEGSALREALDSRQREADAVRQALASSEKARRGEKVKGWLKVGAALGVGYLVGKEVK
jgi:hypothetical protein